MDNKDKGLKEKFYDRLGFSIRQIDVVIIVIVIAIIAALVAGILAGGGF
ncbi:MAG: hypothetical protein LBU77_02725 [Clostridiales bacterium]|jgi:hypothetical protein|nr:hypothetical protein [Clostridiales bacterium]